ncbi:MAG: hydrogenase iron-sulfur subunit [Promethearchaeota archaeon]
MSSNNQRIGVFLCSCSSKITETLDFNAISDYLAKNESLIIEHHDTACLSDGLEFLKESIKKNNLKKVVIAACTPKLYQTRFKAYLQQVGISQDQIEIVNLREQCALPHKIWPQEATNKAIAQINAAIQKVALASFVEKKRFSPQESVLIIGGGIGGLQAALDLASNGIEVSIIEKTPELGGRVRKITRIRGEDDYRAIQELLEAVRLHPNISIFTSSEVKNVIGVPGNYKVSIDGTNKRILDVGAIIVATGMEEFKPYSLKEFGYGLHQNVFIQSDLVNLLDPEGPTNGKVLINGESPKNALFIQCVGSRDSRFNEYCSKLCCYSSIKNAILLREQGIDTAISFIDIRTPYAYEDYYEQARKLGVRFFHGRVSNIEETPMSRQLSVELENSFTGEILTLDTDLVVLSSALISSAGTEDLKEILGINKDPSPKSNFFNPLYAKIKTSESEAKGIFLCGSALEPMFIKEALTHASATAFKVLKYLKYTIFQADLLVSKIDEEACDGCKACVELCPFEAIDFDELKDLAVINELKCEGCGVCAAICPTGAAQLTNNEREILFRQIEALLSTKKTLDGEATRTILAFVCSECAYGSVDLAGINNWQYSPNVLVASVPCIGRISPLDILKGFVEGADAVMLASCPEERCQYLRGNTIAALVVEFTKNILSEIGIDGDKVELFSMTSSEPNKFIDAVNEMNKRVSSLSKPIETPRNATK